MRNASDMHSVRSSLSLLLRFQLFITVSRRINIGRGIPGSSDKKQCDGRIKITETVVIRSNGKKNIKSQQAV